MEGWGSISDGLWWRCRKIRRRPTKRALAAEAQRTRRVDWYKEALINSLSRASGGEVGVSGT